MKIGQVGEFGLINMIDEAVNCQENIIQGIGDDCAVLPFNEEFYQLVTCDMLNEGIHFLRDKISPYQLGYKAVAVSLSDIAAMGGEALSVVIAIGINDTFTVEDWQMFYQGVKAICQKYQVNLIGGDTTRSQNDITIGVTALGLVHKDRLHLRSQAKVGDKVFVTGKLGASKAGLELILRNMPYENWQQPLFTAHLQPEPCLREVEQLNTIFAEDLHSLNDISDGLASECYEIAQASKVGIVLDKERVPINDIAKKLAEELGEAPLEWALFGGEDYQLVGSVDVNNGEFLAQKYRAAGYEFYFIGEVIEEFGVYLLESGKKTLLTKKGYNHFQ